MAADPYINIHSHTDRSSADVICMQNIMPGQDTPNGIFSCGIHPWYINETDLTKQLAQLRPMLNNSNCIALGECGLDKLRGAPEAIQELVFREQVKMAKELDKPLIIHCVKRYVEVLRVLKEENYEGSFLLHGFNSNVENAKPFLTLPGSLFSFGKALLKEGSNAQLLMKQLPVDRFFMETDDSDAGIKLIYEKAAELKATSETELKEQVYNNYIQLFLNGNDRKG